MIQLTRWKVVLVVLATLFGILFTLPNFLTQAQRDALPGFLPNKTLNLGLDLRGGSYLLYEVDSQALIKERLTNLQEDIRTTLAKEQIASSDPVLSGNSVRVQVISLAQQPKAMELLRPMAQPTTGGGVAPFAVTTGVDGTITFSMSDQAAKAEAARAVEQTREVIRRRIDKSGTKEISIVRQGADRIVIEAPGESDPEALKRLVGKTAKLTFQMVDEGADVAAAQAGHVPPGSVLLASDDKYTGPFGVVKRRVLVSGEDLTSANGVTDPQTNQPAISFRFNGKGASRFADVTMHNIGHKFAIILDNRIISAPVINGVIPGGQGQITGNFTTESANEMANLLNNGALPAPLKVLEQSTVGAGLGQEAIEKGEMSLGLGAVAIFIFIILAYGLFGAFAVVALIVNMLMMLGLMSMTQATMTLPGVAGFILTMAVAVDANVLIYERMRDEARTGHSAMSAADQGFRRALVSIIDANVTTLIAAMIMMGMGAGPVKGFAWTLFFGVLTSVFTAVLITQVLIGWWFRIARPKTLPI
jgi:preprotein translocase subunit SecD